MNRRSRFVFYASVICFLLLLSPLVFAQAPNLNETAAFQDQLPYSERVRVEWLEIYGDIFQKLAFLMIAAFVFIRFNWFYRVVERQTQATQKDTVRVSASLTLLGIAACFIGFLRYGQSDWGFLDVQLILTAIVGLLCGIPYGMISGLIGSLFRYFLDSGQLAYVFILISAGLIGGVFLKYRKEGPPNRWLALFLGAVASVIHGAVTYYSFLSSSGLGTVLGLVFSLMVLESLGVFIFVAVLIGVMMDEKRRALERLVPQMKLKFLQAQINPHFLFNALNTIAAICSRENAEQARNLVIKLSNFFRRIVKHDDEWVTLEEELEHADSYIEIEKARYQDRLQIKKDIQLTKAGFRVEVPVLIIQPIIENAIRHGIAPMPKGGLLEICARENGKMVEIEIRDNGVGIAADKLKSIFLSEDNSKEKEGVGIGLWNINERLRYLYGPEHTLNIKSDVGQGTAIRFKIPLEDREED